MLHGKVRQWRLASSLEEVGRALSDLPPVVRRAVVVRQNGAGGRGTTVKVSTVGGVSLCCAVLCCGVLWCAVLCCAVVCCAVLWCAVLWCAVLCCSGGVSSHAAQPAQLSTANHASTGACVATSPPACTPHSYPHAHSLTHSLTLTPSPLHSILHVTNHYYLKAPVLKTGQKSMHTITKK